MSENNFGKSIALGAAAGLVGTVALQLILNTTSKKAPETIPPIKEEPGAFMIRKTKKVLPESIRDKIPEKLEKVAAKSLGMGYGITFGSLYAAMKPRGGNPWLDGTLLGLGTWVAGYVGWLPATGLMPPVWKHTAKQAWTPIMEHALYGIAVVSAFDWMNKKLYNSSTTG